MEKDLKDAKTKAIHSEADMLTSLNRLTINKLAQHCKNKIVSQNRQSLMIFVLKQILQFVQGIKNSEDVRKCYLIFLST